MGVRQVPVPSVSRNLDKTLIAGTRFWASFGSDLALTSQKPAWR